MKGQISARRGNGKDYGGLGFCAREGCFLARNKRPGAEAPIPFGASIPRPEGRGFYRRLALRGLMCIWFAEKARAKEFRRRVQFGFLGKRERPAAEAASLSRTLVPWPEGHGFYRRLALRGLRCNYVSCRMFEMAP
jgi:hypothetical protein